MDSAALRKKVHVPPTVTLSSNPDIAPSTLTRAKVFGIPSAVLPHEAESGDSGVYRARFAFFRARIPNSEFQEEQCLILKRKDGAAQLDHALL
jgi:hypothetical protein